jgi:hypothetical protein
VRPLDHLDGVAALESGVFGYFGNGDLNLQFLTPSYSLLLLL